jgi:hypothetical protein
MSNCDPLDDAAAADLGSFFADVHSAATRLPAPAPSPALAAVLANGVSTEKGDSLVRARSNVTGPAVQESGLPKWRQNEVIGASGLFSGLVSKITGLGLVPKILMALGVTLTGVTSMAGAGALPGPLQTGVAGVVNSVTPFNFPSGKTGGGATVTAAAGTTPGANAGASVDANAGAGGASAGVSAGSSADLPKTSSGPHASAGADGGASASVPSVPPIDPGSILNNLPVHIPDCVSQILDSSGHVIPQGTAIASQVLSCVNQLIPSGVIPSSVSNCLSSVLNTIGTSVGSGMPSSIPHLDLSSCVPVDVSKCASSIVGNFGSPAAILGELSNFSHLFNFGSLTNLTNLSSLPGCVNFNVNACISSILNAAPGGLATVDLSSCVPANVIGNLPLPFGQH